MGLLSFFSDKQKFDSELENRVHTRIDAVKEAIHRGASQDEIQKLLRHAARPENFYEVIGGLANTADVILPMILSGVDDENSASDKYRRDVWELFEEEQKNCDEFFFGCEMRTFVIAKAWKSKLKGVPWADVDHLLKLCGLDMDLYRENDWWRVACFYYLAESGLEYREKFKSAWFSMTGDQRLAIVKLLDRDQIAEYRLQN